ncbi:hypothetical protein QFZ77_002898 [Paenibacillus sp. V4I3]|nr:hypothetical protein [Paenibacillus sp. V4I3]
MKLILVSVVLGTLLLSGFFTILAWSSDSGDYVLLLISSLGVFISVMLIMLVVFKRNPSLFKNFKIYLLAMLGLLCLGIFTYHVRDLRVYLTGKPMVTEGLPSTVSTRQSRTGKIFADVEVNGFHATLNSQPPLYEECVYRITYLPNSRYITKIEYRMPSWLYYYQIDQNCILCKYSSSPSPVIPSS